MSIDIVTPKEQSLIARIEQLEAELAKLKQQEPVATLYIDDYGTMKVSQISPPAQGAFLVYLAAGAQQEPEGWQLVPIEPTKSMIEASNSISYRDEGKEHWAAMLEETKETP